MPRVHGCGPRWVWIQTCSKPIQTSRIVTAYIVLLLGEVRRAVCGLASQLWVLGRAGIHGRQCLPRNSAATCRLVQ
eukprot:1158493-Pelagomonas_calceolata.AAC.1